MFGNFQIGLAILITSITGIDLDPLPTIRYEQEKPQALLEKGMFDDLTPLPYQEPVIEPKETLLDSYQERVGDNGGECVAFIQREYESYYTYPQFRGYALYIKPNSEKPEVGGVVLTRELSGVGHSSIIGEIINDELILIESNYNSDKKITVGRTINVKDSRIRGYFNFNVDN